MNNQKIVSIAPVLIGIAISAVLIIGFFLLSGTFTRASDSEPRDVVISNIEQNSAKIYWTTSIETQGVIEYGVTPTALNFFAPESQKTKNHSVDLTLLSPSTTYYFQIRIGDKKYDNGGVPWTFTTKAANKTQILPPSPTTTPNIEQKSPTPIQRLKINNNQTILTCDETECSKIKEKLGKGCTTQDYFSCLKKLTPTSPTLTTPTPTATASSTLTPTITP